MISIQSIQSLSRFFPGLALGAALVLAGTARAGVTLQGEHRTLDGSQPPFTYTVSIDKVKVKMVSSASADNAFIYRADKGLFWMVDNKAKTYTEMTKKDIESMANTMEAAMKKMQEQMANMPPEQREMMEKMMKENMPGAGAPKGKTTYKKTGAGKVGTWACEKYESYQDGVKKSEMCVVDPPVLGFSAADFTALKDMAKPFEKLAKDMQSMMPQDGVDGAPKGAPVKTTVFADGKAKSETLIKSVKKEAFGAGVFDLPTGLTKKTMTMPKGQG